jgi:hypothetical protein
MLSGKQAPHRREKDWFHFSSALAIALVSDYIALRILYFQEPLTAALPILAKALEVAEKSLKLFVSTKRKSPDALTSARTEFGHSIESLRSAAVGYDQAFDEPDLVAFSRDLNDKRGRLYQLVRYGSEPLTDGFEADLDRIIPVIDRFFFLSIMRLTADERRLLFFTSPLKHLLLGSRFDQSKNKSLTLQALRFKNADIDPFEVACRAMDDEHTAIAAAFQSGEETSRPA